MLVPVQDVSSMSSTGCGPVCSLLALPVAVSGQTHDSEGAAANLLVEKEHERCSQHRLQQFSLQAFEQTPNAVLPTGKTSENHETL